MSSLEKTNDTAGAVAASEADVRALCECLRAHRTAMGGGAAVARAEYALARVWELWRARLASGWEPPIQAGEEEGFPWAQVRVSLAGLVQPSPPAPLPSPEATTKGEGQGVRAETSLVALVLAGNTPLLAWPALCAALLAGKAVFVKMSRNEAAGPRLFRETLQAVDPDLANLIHLGVWPGDDPRTAALLQTADILIAYGGDNALAALRTSAERANAPFHGFGHAVSVGVVLADADLDHAAHGFARDVLMYDQAGCLSPQALFVEDDDSGAGRRAAQFADRLTTAFPAAADALNVLPSLDAGRARSVRQARQMVLFTPGVRVLGDPSLRWTVIAHTQPVSAGDPTGFGVIPVIPLQRAQTHLPAALGRLRGFLSSVGVAGTVTNDLRAVLAAQGATRICEPGAMQAPPLDWQNGGVDLFAALRRT